MIYVYILIGLGVFLETQQDEMSFSESLVSGIIWPAILGAALYRVTNRV